MFWGVFHPKFKLSSKIKQKVIQESFFVCFDLFSFLLFCQLFKHNKSLEIHFLSHPYKENKIKISRLHCPDFVHFLHVQEWRLRRVCKHFAGSADRVSVHAAAKFSEGASSRLVPFILLCRSWAIALQPKSRGHGPAWDAPKWLPFSLCTRSSQNRNPWWPGPGLETWKHIVPQLPRDWIFLPGAQETHPSL